MQSDMLKLSVINKQIKTNKAEFISKCEKHYEDQLDIVTQKILENEKIRLVLLAGPSSSGKTTTSNMIAKKLGEHGKKAKAIAFDNFYHDQEVAFYFEDGTIDYETIKALDTSLLISCLKDLVTKGETMLPEFNFVAKKRTLAKTKMTLEKDEIIILEGLHALNPEISADFAEDSLIKLYVSVSSRITDDEGDVIFSKRDLRFIRRLIRDYHYRSSSVDNTLYLWNGVLMGEDRYIFPYSPLAAYKIDSIHPYEICVFKENALELLKQTKTDSKSLAYTKELIEKLGKVNDLSEKNVPKDSLLVEFIAQR